MIRGLPRVPTPATQVKREKISMSAAQSQTFEAALIKSEKQHQGGGQRSPQQEDRPAKDLAEGDESVVAESSTPVLSLRELSADTSLLGPNAVPLPLAILAGARSLSEQVGKTLSATRSAVENVRMVDELSSAMQRLHAQVVTLDTNGILGSASETEGRGRTAGSEFTSLHSKKMAEGSWTIALPGNALGVHSVQLQLSNQGIWNIHLAMRSGTKKRVSNVVLESLTRGLVSRGHRIDRISSFDVNDGSSHTHD